MKKKYRVDLHRYGALNGIITNMVANHNDGLSSFNLIDVVGLINSFKCANPLYNSGFCHQWDPENPGGTRLLISENGGQSFTLTISQIQVSPLNNVVESSENNTDNEKI
jgi:hypothetical protein